MRKMSGNMNMVFNIGYVVFVCFLTLLAIDYLSNYNTRIDGMPVVDTTDIKAKPENIIFRDSQYVQNGKEVVKYAYITEAVPPEPGEDIAARTPNSQTFPLRTYKNEHGEEVQEKRTIFFASPQLFKDKEGKWRQVEYATTTPEKLTAMGATLRTKQQALRDYLIPGETAYALTGTFNPNPDAEVTSMDGYTICSGINYTWSSCQASTTGSLSYDSTTDLYVGSFDLYVNCGTYCGFGIAGVYRSFLLFDTSSLPNSISISSASVSLYASSTVNTDNDGTDTVNLVTSTPASNTGLVSGDHDQVGTTLQASAIDITSISTGAYNTFTLNGTGQGNVSTTGITKFALREGHDLANSGPTYPSEDTVLFKSADSAGTSQDPKLDITYTNSDATAPTPNPATFSTSPNNDAEGQISMVATTGSDAAGSTPVEYQFVETTGSCSTSHGTGGTNSAWQTTTSYTDTGLQPNKCYAYTIQLRDSVPNTGTASGATQTYSSAAIPGAPGFISSSASTITISNTENGNPSSNPTTNFAVLVTSTDSTWNNKYVNGSGAPSATAVWLTDAQIDNLVVTSIQSSIAYTFSVKARNQDSDETAFGSGGTFFTSSSATVRLLRGTRLLRGVRLY